MSQRSESRIITSAVCKHTVTDVINKDHPRKLKICYHLQNCGSCERSKGYCCTECSKNLFNKRNCYRIKDSYRSLILVCFSSGGINIFPVKPTVWSLKAGLLEGGLSFHESQTKLRLRNSRKNRNTHLNKKLKNYKRCRRKKLKSNSVPSSDTKGQIVGMGRRSNFRN